MLSVRVEAEIALRSTMPPAWSVEAINTDGEGGVDVTVFSGPRARERAVEYATWKYGSVQRAIGSYATLTSTSIMSTQVCGRVCESPVRHGP